MNKKLAKTRDLRCRVREALDTFAAGSRKLVNQTDPDCAIMHSVQGSHASYNVQSVVDDKHGLIVNTEAVSDTGDVNQFARQIEQANEVVERTCDAVCADAGYANTDELEKIDAQGIKVIVPSQRQALHKEESPFSKSHFVYDNEQDCYICPEGCRLYYQSTDKSTGKRHYLIADKHLYFSCKHYGVCTSSKKGRKINRLLMRMQS